MTESGNWCEKALGYQFSDDDLLSRALTHRSAGGSNNERLEFLGDAVLGLTIAKAMFDAKPDADEGVLHLFRVDLVRRETLADLARELDLGGQLHMSPDQYQTGGHQRASVLANALEAVFGAIFVDGGYVPARDAILRVYAERLGSLPAAAGLKDAKSRLQELLQARKLPPPDYSLADTSGSDHARIFEAACRVDALDLTTYGSGTSRQRAEQAAALAALGTLADEPRAG